MRETWVRSLSQEDPLEKEMATHSSILAWRIPWTEEPGGLQSTGSDTTEQLHFHFFFSMYFCPFVGLYVEFFFNISKVTSILHFCTLIYLLQLLPPHDFQQTGSFSLRNMLYMLYKYLSYLNVFDHIFFYQYQ